MSISTLNDLQILGQLTVREFMNKAGLTTEGVVKLTSALNSESEVIAATAKAAKIINDNAETRVKKAGDIMTGALQLFQDANLKHTTNKFSIDAKNSAIHNVNEIVFSNHATSESGIGILFLKTGKVGGSTTLADYDVIRLHNSVPYFNTYELLYQNPANKDTSYYTKKGTDDAISVAIAAVINGSQATLDTLKELAAAIGNDPNFATNIAKEVATKLPKAGGTMTGNIVMDNSNKIVFQDINTFIQKANNNSLLYSTDGLNGHMFNKDIHINGEIYSSKTVNNVTTEYKVWTAESFNPSNYYSKNEEFTINGPLKNTGTSGANNTIMSFGSVTANPATNYNWQMNYLGANSGAGGNQYQLLSNTGKGLTFDHLGNLKVDGDIFTNTNRKVWDSTSWNPDQYIGSTTLTKLGRYIKLGDVGVTDYGIVELDGPVQSKLLMHNLADAITSKLFSIALSVNSGTLFKELMILYQNGLLHTEGGVESSEYKFNNSNTKIVYNNSTNCLEFVVKR